MTLIVEDGTGVADANSYADLATLRAYALERGVALSADDTVLEAQAHKAMDYLDFKELGLLSRTFPMDNNLFCGLTMASALNYLAKAQAQLCMKQAEGIVLLPVSEGAQVIEETVGPITTKFSDGQGASRATPIPAMPEVDMLLKPLRTACGIDAFKFGAVRV